jgi:hypothetical protein
MGLKIEFKYRFFSGEKYWNGTHLNPLMGFINLMIESEIKTEITNGSVSEKS